MASVRYNNRNSFTFPHSVGSLVLFPGVNIGIADKVIEELKQHPITRHMLEVGEMDILTKDPTPEVDIMGIPVVDDKATDEPLPVLNVGDRSAAKKAAAKAKETGTAE